MGAKIVKGALCIYALASLEVPGTGFSFIASWHRGHMRLLTGGVGD